SHQLCPFFNTFGEKVRETGEDITNYGASALSLVRWYYIIPVLVCQLQNDYLLIVSKSFSEIITNVLHRLDLPHTRIIIEQSASRFSAFCIDSENKRRNWLLNLCECPVWNQSNRIYDGLS